ncbi:MAG: hypothetical protein ACREFE_07150 [Limisphaerales bacterium]
MKSHFILNRGATAVCAVASAATLLNGTSSAQSYIAADYATNSIYSGGWSAGQNGGTGFGPWSFDYTDATPPGQYQGMSSSSALGTAWTLSTFSDSSGLANAGRSIPGGLQVGQTFQATIQNPVNNAGIYTYRGFDILFTSDSDNDAGGDNRAALRLQVFDYFNPAMNWHINDIGNYSPSPAVSGITTGASGMIIDFTLTSTNTYTLSLSPATNAASPYLVHSGTIVTTNLPINYVNFRLWNTVSSGLTDTADNFEISSMTIAGFYLNIQKAGTNAILSWPTNVPGFYLESTTNLGPSAVWNTNLPSPVVINDQNVVTNPIAGNRQFYRLQQ